MNHHHFSTPIFIYHNVQTIPNLKKKWEKANSHKLLQYLNYHMESQIKDFIMNLSAKDNQIKEYEINISL
jgi:hypothetical protein